MNTLSLITGNTYPHRQALRALGGRWNPIAQGWEVPAELADRCRALVAGPRTVSTVVRFSSGAEIYQNRRGRCEDAPCCGCCS
jgi:hypothetical protein